MGIVKHQRKLSGRTGGAARGVPKTTGAGADVRKRPSTRAMGPAKKRRPSKPGAQFNDSDWEMLLDRIKDGNCTPFLGSGVNHGILPTGTSIAQEWAKQYLYPLQDKSDLARVSQFLAIHTMDPVRPKELVLSLFKKKMANFDLRNELKKQTNALTVLAELPLPVYITTNYDDFMLQALTFEGKKPRLEVCDWNNLVSNRYPSVLKDYSPSENEPVVFHFHGHKDMALSLVLTEDDYLDFLVHVSEFKETVPPRIQQALAMSSLLFVGYSLADVDFRVVLRALLNKTMPSSKYSSVGIQLPPEEGPEARAYLDRYFEKVKVKVYWGKADEFVTELKRRWDVSYSGKQ